MKKALLTSILAASLAGCAVPEIDTRLPVASGVPAYSATAIHSTSSPVRHTGRAEIEDMISRQRGLQAPGRQ